MRILIQIWYIRWLVSRINKATSSLPSRICDSEYTNPPAEIKLPLWLLKFFANVIFMPKGKPDLIAMAIAGEKGILVIHNKILPNGTIVNIVRCNTLDVIFSNNKEN